MPENMPGTMGDLLDYLARVQASLADWIAKKEDKGEPEAPADDPAAVLARARTALESKDTAAAVRRDLKLCMMGLDAACA